MLDDATYGNVETRIILVNVALLIFDADTTGEATHRFIGRSIAELKHIPCHPLLTPRKAWIRTA